MKKKTRNKILGITTTALMSLAIGGVLLVANQNENYAVAKAYSYDDTTHVMTLNVEDLETTNTEWADNLAELEQADELSISSLATYNGIAVQIDGVSSTYIQWNNFADYCITFYISGENKGKWTLEDENQTQQIQWEYALTLSDAQQLAETYEEPPQPEQQSMGASIINAIKSGLGLIGDLAGQFLLGFSTLFWDRTNSSLTQFGTFSLVMLGIAITFSVIALCLNVLRSNTGV